MEGESETIPSVITVSEQLESQLSVDHLGLIVKYATDPTEIFVVEINE